MVLVSEDTESPLVMTVGSCLSRAIAAPESPPLRVPGSHRVTIFSPSPFFFFPELTHSSLCALLHACGSPGVEWSVALNGHFDVCSRCGSYREFWFGLLVLDV